MPKRKDILLEEEATYPSNLQNGNNHLLVIAIDDYMHCPKLNNCVKDAAELIEILDSKYGISINAELPPLFNGDATKESITHSFRKLAEKVTPKDNVLIYFSGHGEYDKVLNQGYWVPAEAKKGRIDTYIPNSEVRVFLEAIKSHHTFMMVDSCFSGALFVDKEVDKNIERLEQDPSRWGLTSGRNEIVSDGKPGENSPFAESLLYRLKQNTGSLGVMHLCSIVLEQVVANAIQTPRGEPLRVGGHKGGQFVFKLKKEDEDEIWVQALKINTIDFYETYLERFPNGPHTNDALAQMKKLEEELQWEAAKIANTISSWLNFIRDYPYSPHNREARERINSLEDLEDWNNANRRGRVTDFLDYIDRHPQGKYIKKADQHISKLRGLHKEADAWRRAKNEHTIKSYQDYLDEYSYSANVTKAKAELEALLENERASNEMHKEEEYWSTTKRKDDLSAYEQYVRNYPAGLHNKEAQERIITLKAKEAKAKDHNAWEQAKQANSITAYLGYVNAGHVLYKGDAEKAIAALQKTAVKQNDETAWQVAVKKNSKQGYQEYIRAGYLMYRNKAEEKIEALNRAALLEAAEMKDRKEWGEALNSNTIQAYQRYIASGFILYKGDAEKAIATLQKTAAKQNDETAWQDAVKKNSKQGYQEYIRAGYLMYRNKAEEKIEALNRAALLEAAEMKDRKEWGEALNSNTIQAYQRYIASGFILYKGDAEKAIATLQKVVAEQKQSAKIPARTEKVSGNTGQVKKNWASGDMPWWGYLIWLILMLLAHYLRQRFSV